MKLLKSMNIKIKILNETKTTEYFKEELGFKNFNRSY